RRMKKFQQSFYIDTVAGVSIAEGPSRSGSGIGNAPQIASGGSGAGGFMGLLQTRQQIRNQEASVAALRDSLAQLQAAFDAGRISNRLQVDQARQALYNGQSSLLTSYSGLDTSLDNYKVSLGLPPDLEVVVEDELLERFNLVDPSVSALQSRVAAILGTVRRPDRIETPEDLTRQLERLQQLEPVIDQQLKRAEADLDRFTQQLPERREQLTLLKERPELKNVHMDPELFDAEILEDVAETLGGSLEHLEDSLAGTRRNLEALRETPPPPNLLERMRSRAVSDMTTLSSHLLELSLIQAAARLESITLKPIDLEYDVAYDLAESNRLDWMNARAGLVDSWRQVAVNQEALKTGLNLIVNGDVPTVGNEAFSFTKGAGRVRVGLELDTPVRRLEERNIYRETLISYQRSRRGYMLFEDEAKQSLRNTLRVVKLSQLNFEVRRAAVRIAIAQVDLARLRLNEPPKPGEGGNQFGATTARDLVDALGDLLGAQNDFLNVWVGFEVLRMSLDYELGVMRLDEGGMWVDPGPITGDLLKDRIQERRQLKENLVNLPVAEVAPEAPDPAAAEPRKRRGIFAIFKKQDETPKDEPSQN
ncbi:MAG: TolC family protein, partial [Verrucomicrobiota bacterium]